jgi:hypothetical protein
MPRGWGPDPTANKRKADKQEKRLADMIGARVQPGSGSGWKRRQDVRSVKFLWEMKRTDNKKSISLKMDDLSQLRKNALMDGRVGVMHVEIGDKRFIVLSEDDFLEMTGLEMSG